MEKKKRPASREESTDGNSGQFLPDDSLSQIDAYWRAANYLSVGQITCSTILCSKSHSSRNTSSRGCWDIGGRRWPKTSSMLI